MDKINQDVYNATKKFANKNKILVTKNSDQLIKYAIAESLAKVNGLDNKLDEISKSFYNDTLLYYVRDDSEYNDKAITDMIREAINAGIEEYKKIF